MTLTQCIDVVKEQFSIVKHYRHNTTGFIIVKLCKNCHPAILISFGGLYISLKWSCEWESGCGHELLQKFIHKVHVITHLISTFILEGVVIESQ